MDNFALAYLKVQNASQPADASPMDPQFYSNNTLSFDLSQSLLQYAGNLTAGNLELLVQPSLAESADYNTLSF